MIIQVSDAVIKSPGIRNLRMKSLFWLTVEGHSLSQREGPGFESVRHLKPLYLQIKITDLLNLSSSCAAYNLNPGNEVTHLGGRWVFLPQQ